MKRMKWIILIFIIILASVSSCMVLDGLFEEMLNEPTSVQMQPANQIIELNLNSTK